MIAYLENPKKSTRKLLEVINEYIPVVSYEVNLQKSVAFYVRVTCSWEK